MKSTYERGIHAEASAKIYLEKKGFSLIKARYRTPFGEIDLLMHDGDVIVAIEVKYRKHAADSFDCLKARQQKRIENALLFYTHENGLNSPLLRLDVVLLSPGKQITHIENAWQAEQ